MAAVLLFACPNFVLQLRYSGTFMDLHLHVCTHWYMRVHLCSNFDLARSAKDESKT